MSEVNKEFSKSIQSSVLNPYTESSRQIDTKTRENLDKINKVGRFFNIKLTCE